jgi:hypothetical protein
MKNQHLNNPMLRIKSKEKKGDEYLIVSIKPSDFIILITALQLYI